MSSARFGPVLSLPLSPPLLDRLVESAVRRASSSNESGVDPLDLFRVVNSGGGDDRTGSPVLVHAVLARWVTALDAIREFNVRMGDTGGEAGLLSYSGYGTRNSPSPGAPSLPLSLVLVMRDPLTWQESPVFNSTTAVIETRSGRLKISPWSFWMEVIDAIKPNLAEVPSLDLPASCRTQRLRKSADEGQRWIDSVLSGPEEAIVAAAAAEEKIQKRKGARKKGNEQPVAVAPGSTTTAAASSFAVPGMRLIPVIQGGTNILVRQTATKGAVGSVSKSEWASSDAGSAVAIGSLFLGETDAERANVMRTVCDELPADVVRFVNVGTAPLAELLDMVSMGGDVLTSAYADVVTEMGMALCFDLVPASINSESSAMQDVHEDTKLAVSHPTKLHLRDARLQLDFSPLVAGCACDACHFHTRGYLYHLIRTHELLGTTLLSVHNWFHMLRWFEVIRERVASGTFEAYRKWWFERHDFTL